MIMEIACVPYRMMFVVISIFFGVVCNHEPLKPDKESTQSGYCTRKSKVIYCDFLINTTSKLVLYVAHSDYECEILLKQSKIHLKTLYLASNVLEVEIPRQERPDYGYLKCCSQNRSEIDSNNINVLIKYNDYEDMKIIVPDFRRMNRTKQTSNVISKYISDTNNTNRSAELNYEKVIFGGTVCVVICIVILFLVVNRKNILLLASRSKTGEDIELKTKKSPGNVADENTNIYATINYIRIIRNFEQKLEGKDEYQSPYTTIEDVHNNVIAKTSRRSLYVEHYENENPFYERSSK